MKIPLAIQNCAGGIKPFLFGVIRQTQFRVFGRIRLFIDTGSPWSTISERDSKRWRLSYERLGTPKIFQGISGGSISGSPLQNITLSVKDVENNLVTLSLSKIYLLKGKVSETLPNILGEDFLTENRFRFCYTPCEKVAYLEKVE